MGAIGCSRGSAPAAWPRFISPKTSCSAGRSRVKVLHQHFAEDQEFVERFRREASSAAGLSHQNIVGIFDRGEWNGTYYIAMEYVAGRSLKTIVREDGALDPLTAIDIVVQILRGARFAHRRGVVHRDLKPHNVIVDEEGRARVTDFGIARAGASDMTLTGSIMGTAQYLSPEQAQGQAVSASSDLYSVGVILYELLTGVVPFEGETAVAIAFKQVSAEPLPPERVEPGPACLARRDRAARAREGSRAALRRRRRVHRGASAGAPCPAPVRAGPRVPATGRIRSGHRPAADAGGWPVRGRALIARTGNHRRVWLWSGVAALVVAAVVLALVLSSGSGKVKVPDVVGLTEAAAVVRLKGAGLVPVAASSASATTANGVVFGQTPAFGQVVKDGARVNLVVSSGPPTTPLANVEGLSAARAESKLRAAGFKPATKPKASTSIGEGLVIATEPPAGTSLPVGTTVTVLVSSGPSPVRVPDTVGETRAAAEAALETAELGVGTVTQQVSATQTPETVLSQSPAAGSMLRFGGKVNLVVAKAPKDVSVPAVVGQNETEAAAALGRAGFSPKAVTEPTTESSQVGVVLKQSPAAGASAPKGATVTITVGVLSGATTPTTPTTTTPTTPTTTGATVPLRLRRPGEDGDGGLRGIRARRR